MNIPPYTVHGCKWNKKIRVGSRLQNFHRTFEQQNPILYHKKKIDL